MTATVRSDAHVSTHSVLPTAKFGLYVQRDLTNIANHIYYVDAIVVRLEVMSYILMQLSYSCCVINICNRIRPFHGPRNSYFIT